MEKWDTIYRQKGRSYISSLDHMPALLQLFEDRKVKKVLDLGCGSGAHIAFLAKHGFEVYGIDISEEAISIARERLKEEKLNGDVKVGHVFKRLPYEDRFFDAVVSFRVIHHARIEEIRKAIQEIERILKPHGLVFMTIRKMIPKKKMTKHRMLNSRTYVPIEGEEEGVVHYLFNKKLLRKEFKNFKIYDIRIDQEKEEWELYYCLIGELR